MKGNQNSTENHNKILFREVQYNRQFLPWAIILVIAILLTFGFIRQVILGNTFGPNPAPDIVLTVFFFVFGLVLPVSFATMNLTTEVRSDSLYYRFFPFHLTFRRISYGQLKDAKVSIYHPLAEYGGWGIRFGLHGKAYNISGDCGVRLSLDGRSSLLLGSRHPEKLLNSLSCPEK